MKNIDTKTGTIVLLATAYLAMAIIAAYALNTVNLLSK